MFRVNYKVTTISVSNISRPTVFFVLNLKQPKSTRRGKLGRKQICGSRRHYRKIRLKYPISYFSTNFSIFLRPFSSNYYKTIKNRRLRSYKDYARLSFHCASSYKRRLQCHHKTAKLSPLSLLTCSVTMNLLASATFFLFITLYTDLVLSLRIQSLKERR